MFNSDLFNPQWLVLFLLVTIGFTEAAGHIPQTIKLFRSRDKSGLSAISLSVSLSNYLLWSIYYFTKGFYGLLTVNSIATVIYLLLVVGAIRAGLTMGRSLAIAGGYFLGTMSLFIFAPVVLPLVLLAGAAFMFSTACLEAQRSDSVSGLAPLTWIGLLACGLASLILGVLPGRADWAIASWGLIASAAASFILVKISVEQRGLITATVMDEIEHSIHTGALAIESLVESCNLGENQHAEECVCV